MEAAVCVLMAGGLGTRLWPWSRRERPKQFLPLLGDRSLIGMTWDRVAPLTSTERTLILTNAHLVGVAQGEFPEVPAQNLFGEPKSCNTAPCIALAAAVCEKRWGPKAVMMVLSADHYIGDVKVFRSALASAIECASSESSLLTLGIPPSRPDPGYGYLECDRKIEDIPAGEVTPLVAFHEKPSVEKAMEFLGTGRFLWNMGTFVWRCDAILSELESQMPELIRRARAAIRNDGSTSQKSVDQFYLDLPKDQCLSIDYGIMEKAKDVKMAPCPVAWDDVGSWGVLRRLRHEETDADGNLSMIRHLAIDTGHTVVAGSESENGVVVTLGVEGLVIVRDGERVLVASESALDRMREVVEGIRAKGWDHLL